MHDIDYYLGTILLDREVESMQNFPKIAAITINYGTPSDTLECVQSLRQQTYPNLEIIVVDNNSPDGLGTQLQKK